MQVADGFFVDCYLHEELVRVCICHFARKAAAAKVTEFSFLRDPHYFHIVIVTITM